MFWRYGWLKNPAIWLAANVLAHISGTKIIQNTVNNLNFHYRTNSVKIQKPKFSINWKKNMFLAHFWLISQFWGLKTFSGESSSVTHKFIWISSTRPKLEKANDKIPQRLDGRTKGWRTGPISPLFLVFLLLALNRQIFAGFKGVL